MDQEADIAAKEQKLSFPSKNSHSDWMKHALRLAENAKFLLGPLLLRRVESLAEGITSERD